jgi:3-oxoacyl-[acyl-carrier protein] reductase
MEDRVVIVTGSTRGIGRSVALRLVGEGAKVVVHGRDQATADELAAGLPGCIGIGRDLTSEGAADAIVEATVARYGRLDALVNNAGAAIDNFITGVSDDRWDQSIAVNLSAPFAMLRAAVRVMKSNDSGGVIVNVISWAGERGNVGQVAYSAAKAGLHAVTLSAAKELGKFGIRVNSLSPAVATDMTAVMDDRLKQAAGRRRPLKIEGTLDDVAEGVLFLVSDRSRFVTGDTLHVDGGLHLN